MTPAEWESSADPDAMLAAAGDRISDRKLLLFGCAAARRNSDILPEFATTLIQQIEEAAEAPTAAERAARVRAAIEATGSIPAHVFVVFRANAPIPETVRWAAGALRWQEQHRRTQSILLGIASLFTELRRAPRLSPEQAHLLRCVAGYAFAATAFDPAWRTADVIALATGAYEESAFDRLPILADALQDAGCGDAELLAHLRSPGPHARGCWPLDLVLSKS